MDGNGISLARRDLFPSADFDVAGFIRLTGVQITQPLADALTFLSCLPLAYGFFRGLENDSGTP